MKCPYCKSEMDIGFLPASKMPLYWIPESSRAPAIAFSKPNGGIKLTNFPKWSIKKAVSFYCKKCEVVITPVNKNI